MNDKEIPRGMYCYERNDTGKIKICPYWSLNLQYETQNNGHCSYLNEGDWEHEWPGLLWDQVKECTVNTDFNDD